MKRFFDLFFALVLICLLGIPMLVISGVILMSMGSPVLFRQMRPGYLGRPFEILKFRTMNNDHDDEGKLLPDNVRLTYA